MVLILLESLLTWLEIKMLWLFQICTEQCQGISFWVDLVSTIWMRHRQKFWPWRIQVLLPLFLQFCCCRWARYQLLVRAGARKSRFAFSHFDLSGRAQQQHCCTTVLKLAKRPNIMETKISYGEVSHPDWSWRGFKESELACFTRLCLIWVHVLRVVFQYTVDTLSGAFPKFYVKI